MRKFNKIALFLHGVGWVAWVAIIVWIRVVELEPPTYLKVGLWMQPIGTIFVLINFARGRIRKREQTVETFD